MNYNYQNNRYGLNTHVTMDSSSTHSGHNNFNSIAYLSRYATNMRRPNGQAYFYLVTKHQLWTFTVIRYQNNEIISIVKELMRLRLIPSISGFPSGSSPVPACFIMAESPD